MRPTTDYAMPGVGDVIAGKYRLEKVAGEGGMGIVYAAEHLVLRQRVAVKILLPDAAQSEAVVERFSREAQAAARIQSDHVARVMDAGSLASGAPFLVMEYLEGCDLEELLELQGALSVEEVADYVIQACEALAHAHAAGIVHRDLKPANLFLACRPDGDNVIKIVDFGISKTVKARPEDKKLTGQHVLGSPVYMSPEQLRNAKEIDGRADIWSLGVVAYELLTGGPPFDGDGVGEIFAAILEKEPVPIHQKNWRVPEELANVIDKCLMRDPDDRWRDAGALAKAMVPFGTGKFKAVPERIEQVIARAKLMKVDVTPVEARRVVDAIAAAAERARTTGGGTMPGTAHASERMKLDAADTIAEPIPLPGDPSTAPMVAPVPPARGRRWIPLAAAAALVLGVLGTASLLAVRATRGISGAAPPPAVNLSAQGLVPAGSAGDTASAPSGSADEENAPMVMDLPENGGHTSGGPASRRNPGQTGKPQRPKFLKTRE